MLLKSGFILTLALSAILPTFAFAEDSNNTAAMNLFEKFKALRGEWVMADDSTEGSRFEVLSEGSVVAEYFMGMINMISVDKDRLRITHYCSMGNQPSFLAAVNFPYVNFEFERVTNLQPGAGYIADVDFEFMKDGSLTEHWVHRNGDGSQKKMTFSLVRKVKQ